MKKYCVSLELAKEMKELGFEQKSLWYWLPIGLDFEIHLDKTFSGYEKHKIFSAYTVGELGEMLPDIDIVRQALVDNTVSVFSRTLDERYFKYGCKWFISDTEANARAKLLIYLKKEGVL